MSSPALPPNESERLRSLKALGLLDTPPEERFDRITRLAQALFDVPIALMSLSDADRQWFKSRQGLDVAEIPRERSFCDRAIQGSELFIVPDATRDPRFSDNPLVAGPAGVRFYAGAPLSAPGGQKIGTLCLIDRRPRELSPQQRTALRDLADLMQGEIGTTAFRASVAKRNPAARRKAARLKVLGAFAAAYLLIGAFTGVSRRAMRRLVDDSAAAAGPAQVSADASRLDELVLVGSGMRALVLALALAALLWDMAKRGKAEDELRRSHDEALSGSERLRAARAEAEKLGERLGAVLDHIDVGVVVVEPDGSFSLYNVAAERINGAWRDEIERVCRAGAHPLTREDEKTVIPSGDDPLGRALKGETVRNERVFWRTPFRPKGYHLNMSAVPLRDQRGLPNGVVMMFTERAAA